MRGFTLVLIWLCASAAVAADYRVETVAEGLDHPWSLAFLPDGRMLVSERPGRLRIIIEGALEPAPVDGVPAVYARSQGGLFDVLPHPDFGANGLLFLSFAHGDASANATRLVRARLDGHRLTGIQELFTATPMKTTPVHYGGRMAIGPDRHLYLTIGDGFDWREQAQNPANHLGSVVRLNLDGSVPADNPLIGREGHQPEIFAWGLRNPQGLAFAGERLYLHDHGPQGGDELNLIEAGANYGWPVATYGVDYSGALVSPFQSRPGMQAPLTHWTPSIAPSGLAAYHGGLFPGWQGDLFVTALAERSLRRLEMRDGQVIAQHRLLEELDERLRDVRVGPDGALYVLTDSSDGRVLRLTPAAE